MYMVVPDTNMAGQRRNVEQVQISSKDFANKKPEMEPTGSNTKGEIPNTTLSEGNQIPIQSLLAGRTTPRLQPVPDHDWILHSHGPYDMVVTQPSLRLEPLGYFLYV